MCMAKSLRRAQESCLCSFAPSPLPPHTSYIPPTTPHKPLSPPFPPTPTHYSLYPDPPPTPLPDKSGTLQVFVPAAMDKTLESNGIVDDDLAFEKLGIDDEGYMPALHIYYNDDLTIA